MSLLSNTKSKYNAKKTTVDGIKFDSKAEAECYMYLKLLERNNQIKIIELQPKVYMTKARILFKLDFLINQTGEEIYIDVKGFSTPVFNIKKRLWGFYGKGKLRIIKQSRFGFNVHEEIISNNNQGIYDRII